MKHRCINKGKNDKSKYLNNPPLINNKKSREIIWYQLYLQKCKNSSLKICNNE